MRMPLFRVTARRISQDGEGVLRVAYRSRSRLLSPTLLRLDVL